MMSSTMQNAMFARRPGKRTLVITHLTFAGVGRSVGKWLGGNFSDWEHYHFLIVGMLGFTAVYQVPMVGSDICGFGKPFACTLWGEEADVGVQQRIRQKSCGRGGWHWVLFICLCAMCSFLLGMNPQCWWPFLCPDCRHSHKPRILHLAQRNTGSQEHLGHPVCSIVPSSPGTTSLTTFTPPSATLIQTDDKPYLEDKFIRQIPETAGWYSAKSFLSSCRSCSYCCIGVVGVLL